MWNIYEKKVTAFKPNSLVPTHINLKYELTFLLIVWGTGTVELVQVPSKNSEEFSLHVMKGGWMLVLGSVFI